MATITRPGWRERYNDFIRRHEIAWELTMAALAVVFVAVGFSVEFGAGRVGGFAGRA